MPNITTTRKENNMGTSPVAAPAGAFPGTTVARHNGYSLRRDELSDGAANWHATRPAGGHRISYRPGTVDVFSVDPEWRGVYGNADTESYARSLLAAVEAATVFAGIVDTVTVHVTAVER